MFKVLRPQTTLFAVVLLLSLFCQVAIALLIAGGEPDNLLTNILVHLLIFILYIGAIPGGLYLFGVSVVVNVPLAGGAMPFEMGLVIPHIIVWLTIIAGLWFDVWWPKVIDKPADALADAYVASRQQVDIKTPHPEEMKRTDLAKQLEDELLEMERLKRRIEAHEKKEPSISKLIGSRGYRQIDKLASCRRMKQIHPAGTSRRIAAPSGAVSFSGL